MAAPIKGKDVLIKLDNSGAYQTIGGLRSSTITLNDEAVDVTHKDSDGYRTLPIVTGKRFS